MPVFYKSGMELQQTYLSSTPRAGLARGLGHCWQPDRLPWGPWVLGALRRRPALTGLGCASRTHQPGKLTPDLSVTRSAIPNSCQGVPKL